jgi:hypothetical protein
MMLLNAVRVSPWRPSAGRREAWWPALPLGPKTHPGFGAIVHRPYFHIVGLLENTALAIPELLESKNYLLNVFRLHRSLFALKFFS